MTIKTSQVTNRRELRFESFGDILLDVEGILGRSHRTLGNWSAAQIVEHLALTFRCAVDGSEYKANIVFRSLSPLVKKKTLSQAMTPGLTMPSGMRPDFYPDEAVEEQTALEHLKYEIERYQDAEELAKHVVFGKLKRHEWDQLHFRHAEMHLSFIVLD